MRWSSFLAEKSQALEVAITAATYPGRSPSQRLGLEAKSLADKALADEVDRYCAVLYHEWADERETNRLKRAIAWAFSGEEKGGGKPVACEHEGFDRLPDGGLKCRDCGEVGN